MNYKKAIQIIFLILAAEIVYALPFVLIRLFRPTILEAFEITNQDIGICYSLYGISALASYVISGLLADRFQLKYLMSIALFLTGLGGFAWILKPHIYTLYTLYIYWGITSVIFFWSPLIKATRIWGGKKQQILAFGLLEGGRGIVAAIIGSIGVYIISSMITDGYSSKFLLRNAMNQVCLITSILTILTGFLMLFLPSFNTQTKSNSTRNHRSNIIKALKYPVLWMLMIIILTSYIGFRIADILTQYASEVYGYSSRESAELGTLISYLRPIICVLVIFLAKNYSPTKWLIIGYSIMCIGSILFIFNLNILHLSLLFPLITSLVGVYTLRVLYFTLLEEAKIPLSMTGTVVGILSVIAFSPDIFIGPIAAHYLDGVGGSIGYQYLFILLLVSSLIGLFVAILFNNSIKSKKKLLST